jgi:SNF2 family DNA or RNA helicase
LQQPFVREARCLNGAFDKERIEMKTEIVAFPISRPSTNLVPDERFQLTRAQMKADFMGVFNWQYAGDPRKTLMKIALGAIMDSTMISLGKPKRPTSQEERMARRMAVKTLRKLEEERAGAHLSQYTRLQKVNGEDPHFILSLPVLHFTSVATLSRIISVFGAGQPDNDAIAKLQEMFDTAEDTRIDSVIALRRAHLPPQTVEVFKNCLRSVTFHASKDLVVATLDFKITKIEAEALVSAEWVEIRPVDMYPLFVMWVEAEYVSRLYGKSATSLSRIAKTLPPHAKEDRRTDDYGLTIGMDGQPLYLPQECDNTDLYESRYTSVGTTESGEFALIDVKSKRPPMLPANIPILVDWVNFKFTYSNSAGRPVIMALENMRKCTASMAVNILNRPIPDKFFDHLKGFATACALSTYVTMVDNVAPEDRAEIRKVLRQDERIPADEYFKRLRSLDSQVIYKYRDFVEGTLGVLAPLRSYLMSLHPAMLNNLEALNAKYAVSTVCEALGTLGVMIYYGVPMGETEAVANRANQAALNQGLDPDWTPPDMPLITEKFSKEDSGMLPHQAKVRNLLRESPDFAVLSVDAGGGKSMLSITDILYEIKAKRSAPYLIMCPSHLVANYVAELVEFTDGKVNVIPVTSHNIRTSGYARYEQILERAPLNTVLVVDYMALKFQGRSAVYGTSSVAIFPVVELIRKFRPGYCMLDESHLLKNSKSATFKSVMNLIADIPKKRVASGTLNPDSPSDLPAQIAIMDPTIFGTREDFNETYGAEVSGGRVVRWNTSGPNSVGSAMSKLKKNVVWCQAKRKEWACALPPRKDRFINCELTERQREVYDAIFDDMIMQIRKAAETDKNARKILDSLEGKKAGQEDEEDFGDLGNEGGNEDDDVLDDSSDIGPGLQPYLVDIERFVTNPGFHPYAQNGFVTADGRHIAPLSGEDLIPPKIATLKHLMLKEYDVMNPKAGKVLIFVNYNESARAVFEHMPPELQACGILYSTANKTELVNKFKTDPKIRWMVGIRKSLEVGLNLQVASTLVRIEGVWTPGEQEQGDSRIARPYFGPGGDKREVLKFDTLVANRTLDITKAARLRAKIVALAKFENAGNPAYESLEDIPIIPMRLDAIQTMNDFSTNLAEYGATMAQLNQIILDENEEYKEKILAEGGFKFTQVKQAPVPEGCALLARVPYAQGTELYKASELGLIRIDNYLGMELSSEDEEGDGPEDGEETDEQRLMRDAIIGLNCHTESGDGVIKTLAFSKGQPKYVTVALPDGTTVFARMTNAFIITRTETNSIDMRNKLIQASGLKPTAEITVPAANTRQTRVTQKELREAERQREAEIKERQRQSKVADKQKRLSVSLQLNIVNGYLQIGFVPGSNEKAAKAMEALGFKQNPSYYYTRIRTFKHLINQAQVWADAGFHVGDQYDSGALQALSVALTQNGLQSHRHYANLMGEAQFRNYMRETFRPTSDKMKLNLFALVTDGGWSDPLNIKRAEKRAADGKDTKPAYGLAYLCMPAGGGHPGSRLAISSKYVVAGTKWMLSAPVLTRFVGSVKGVHRVLEEMRAAGIRVSNVDELNQYARSVKRIAPKIDDTVFNPADDDAEFPSGSQKPTTKVKKEKPLKKTKTVPEAPKAKPGKPAKPSKAIKVKPAKPGRKSRGADTDEWALI